MQRTNHRFGIVAIAALALCWGLAVFCGPAVLKAAEAAEAVSMKAGTAKCVITPKEPLTLVTGKLPEGKDHDIFARCLVLNDGASRLVIITYDLNCLDVATPLLRQRCRDELKLDAARLILLGTHNHAAPIQIVPRNFAYGRWLAGRLFDLVQEAIAAEKGPVKVSFAAGPGYFVRSTGNAPTDYEIQALKVTQGSSATTGEPAVSQEATKDSQVVALLFNHPTHPLQSSETRIDVGHPGYAVDEIEAKLPGALVLYADACGGNQFPDRGRIMYGTMEQVKTLGHELAERVLAIAAEAGQDVSGPLRSKLEVLSLPLAPPLPYEEAKKLAAERKVPRDIGFVPYPHPDRGTNWIRALLDHHEQKIPFPTRTTDRVCTDDAYLVREYGTSRDFPCKYEEVIVSRIGPLAFVAMQGEVCAPIGMRIKDAFRRQMPIMVGAYMGEHNLYIPTRELVRVDAYQAQVIRIQYASPVGWAPEVEDEMVDGVIKVVKSMTEETPAEQAAK